MWLPEEERSRRKSRWNSFNPPPHPPRKSRKFTTVFIDSSPCSSTVILPFGNKESKTAIQELQITHKSQTIDFPINKVFLLVEDKRKLFSGKTSPSALYGRRGVYDWSRRLRGCAFRILIVHWERKFLHFVYGC
jgi:hypothetical protein